MILPVILHGVMVGVGVGVGVVVVVVIVVVVMSGPVAVPVESTQGSTLREFE